MRPRVRGTGLACLCLAALLTTSVGCTATHRAVSPATAGLHAGWNRSIAWLIPSRQREQAALARWRGAVGPPVVHTAQLPNPTRADEITVVSWNIANGEGDLLRFIDELPAALPRIILLQEAFRSGPEVPERLAADARFAGRLGGAGASPHAWEIEALAAVLGLNLYYVPSMRNGGLSSNEDRGNAILSDLPLSDLAAIELPFERQRRVAIAATVHGQSRAGHPWQLRVVNVHLENSASIRYAWIGGEYARARQARALRESVGNAPAAIVGGDFNTWFGFTDQAYIETALAFPQTVVSDNRATFRGLLRLDHLFFRLKPGWTAAFRRAEDRFGSDHFPLVGTLRVR